MGRASRERSLRKRGHCTFLHSSSQLRVRHCSLFLIWRGPGSEAIFGIDKWSIAVGHHSCRFTSSLLDLQGVSGADAVLSDLLRARATVPHGSYQNNLCADMGLREKITVLAQTRAVIPVSRLKALSRVDNTVFEL